MTTDIQMNVSYRLGDIECNVARKSNSSVVCLQHIKQGAFYNPHGPAVWRYDEQSGIIVFEYWRGFGPGVGYVVRHAETGEVERDTRPFFLRVRAACVMASTGYGLRCFGEIFWPSQHMRAQYLMALRDNVKGFLRGRISARPLAYYGRRFTAPW